jgi:uncharacterized protein YciI
MKKLSYTFILIVLTLILSFLPEISYSQEEFEVKMGDTTYVMKKYVFGMYKRGENNNLDSAELAKIQTGHLNHLSELAKIGKLCLAGPIDGKNDLRGLLVFDVKNIEEAEELIKKDPAVIAGRLTYELYYWWAAKGSKLK